MAIKKNLTMQNIFQDFCSTSTDNDQSTTNQTLRANSFLQRLGNDSKKYNFLFGKLVIYIHDAHLKWSVGVWYPSSANKLRNTRRALEFTSKNIPGLLDSVITTKHGSVNKKSSVKMQYWITYYNNNWMIYMKIRHKI